MIGGTVAFLGLRTNRVQGFLSERKIFAIASILDVGCGCGKLAWPLTKYLNSEGGYDGIDMINWCNERYQNYPNFRFHFADLHNERYNPRGGFNASNYKFSFQNNEFNVVFLTSLSRAFFLARAPAVCGLAAWCR